MDESREYFLSRLRHYRQEDRHECALVGNRMNWLIMMQAALIISFFIACLIPNPGFVFYSHVCIFAIAAFFACTITAAIRKAELMIYEWHLREKALYKEVEELKNSELVKDIESYLLVYMWERTDTEDKKASDGFSYQRFAFPALMLLWCALLFLSAYNFMQYKASLLGH